MWLTGWAPLRTPRTGLLGMAGVVSLKRVSRLQLPAALDLKSAHGRDHSGRGVPSLEPQCTSQDPCLGSAFGVQPWGLWVPRALF